MIAEKIHCTSLTHVVKPYVTNVTYSFNA